MAEIQTNLAEEIPAMNSTLIDRRPGPKKCSKCKLTKARDQFNSRKAKNKHGEVTGLLPVSWCKRCESEYQHKHYRANFERINSRHKKYYHDNKEACTLRNKAYTDKQRAHVTYRLDFANGTYWYGSTVNLTKRILLHKCRIKNGNHSARLMELCGEREFECTQLAVYDTQAEARAAELVLLKEHVGKDKCLNSIRSAMMYLEND